MDTRGGINQNHYKTNLNDTQNNTTMDACIHAAPSDAVGYCWFTAIVLTLTHGTHKIPVTVTKLVRKDRIEPNQHTVEWIQRPFADGGYALRSRRAEHMILRVPPAVKGCFDMLYDIAKLTTNPQTKAKQTWDNLLQTGATLDEITIATIAMTLPAMSVTLCHTDAHDDTKLKPELFKEEFKDNSLLQLVTTIEETEPKTLYIQPIAVKKNDIVTFTDREIEQQTVDPFQIYQQTNLTWTAIQPNLIQYLNKLKDHVTEQPNMHLLGILLVFPTHATCALFCEEQDHWVLQNAYCPPVNLTFTRAERDEIQKKQEICHDALRATLKGQTAIELFQILAIKT